jgi:DnaJ-class molecular chaperone
VTIAPEITTEVTGITYEGVTYSHVPKGKPSEGRVETCPVCDGTGQMYSRKCRECHGRGLIQQSV